MKKRKAQKRNDGHSSQLRRAAVQGHVQDHRSQKYRSVQKYKKKNWKIKMLISMRIEKTSKM